MHSHFFFFFFLSCSWSCQDINIQFFGKWCMFSHTPMNKVQHLLLKSQQTRRTNEKKWWSHKYLNVKMNSFRFVYSLPRERARVFSLSLLFFFNPPMYVRRRCCKTMKKKNETFYIRTVPPLTYTYWVYTRVLFSLSSSSFSFSCNWTQLAREKNNRIKTASITVDILLC